MFLNFQSAFDSADETRTHLIENLRIISNGTKDFRNYDTQELPSQVHGQEYFELLKIVDWKILTIGRS